MAGKVVDVTLRLIDKLSSPLNSIGSRLERSASQFARAGRQIQNTGKKISDAGSTMTKGITTPIVALGAASVKSFGEVDKSMRLVKETMGETKWATADLEGAIKKSAANSVFSMQEATDATLNFARQGFNAKQSAKMLTPALDLAAGTATDLNAVTDGLGNTLKVFKSQGLDATTAANIFAKAQAQANTTTTDLFESMRVGAPIFKTVGWSMQDLAAVTDVFGDNFISGSEGATAMKTGLARLASPAKEGAVWMDKLKLNLINSDGSMKSMVDTQAELHRAFKGLTQEQKMQAASAIFGKNQMGKWLTLIDTAPKKVKKYRNALDDATGTSHNMANALMNGVGGSVEKLKSTFDVFKYNIGQAISEPVKNVIDKVTGLIDKFNNLDDATKKMIAKKALIIAAIGPVILTFGKLVTGVGKVVSAFGTVGKLFRTFKSVAGILTSPAGIVVGVLAAIAGAAYLIYKNWDKVKPTFERIKTAFIGLVKKIEPMIKELIPKAMDFLTERISELVDFIGELLPVILPIVEDIAKMTMSWMKKMMPVVKDVAKVAGKVIGDIVKAAGKLLKALMPVIKKILQAVQKSMPTIKKAISSAFKAIQPIIKTAVKLFGKIVSVISKNLKKAVNVAKPVIEKLGEVFEKVFPVIAEFVSDAIKRVVKTVKKLQPVFETIFDFVGSVVETFADTFGGVFDGVMTALGGVIDFITGVFSGDWEKAWDGVVSIFSGIFNGVKSIVKGVINTVIDVINVFIKGLNHLKIPDWVPGIGGAGVNIPLIPQLAKGTDNWKGGIVQISERGGEIVDLPSGSRVYPHDKSVKKAYADGAKSGGSVNITVPKLADQIVVRSEADIDAIVQMLADKLEKVSKNMGGGKIGYNY